MKAKGLVLYYSPGCPACAVLKPKIEALVREKNLHIVSKDVRRCSMKGSDDRVCQRMKYVPAVVYDGKEIPLQKLPEKLDEIKRKK